MKKLLFIITALISVSCSNNEINNDTNLESNNYLDSLEIANKVDSIMADIENKSKLPDNKTELEDFKKSVSIIKYFTNEPNSAGGVDCNVIWKNLSSKTVKYAYFTVKPYNAVNDPVKSEISSSLYDDGTITLKVTGPVRANSIDGYNTYWECMWYNSTIDYMKITGIEIEYMDGTKISTSDQKIIESIGFVRKPNN